MQYLLLTVSRYGISYKVRFKLKSTTFIIVQKLPTNNFKTMRKLFLG